MPVDGQPGTAPDGTPVVWSAKLNRAVPAATAKAFGVTGFTKPTNANATLAQPVSPEDQTQLNEMAKGIESKRYLADQSAQFMAAAKGVPLGPQYGQLPSVVMSKDAVNPLRRRMQITDPATEAKLENLDAINAAAWTAQRPAGSGPIRAYEATGWKQSFPSVVNFGAADAAIDKRLQGNYANASNELDYAQNYAHSGKGGVAAGRAAFQNMLKSPAAAGRQQALGAAPEDFSGRQPGWTSQMSPKQLATAKLFAHSQSPPGDRNNPYAPMSDTEARSLPGGAWFIDDDGTLGRVPARGAKR